MYTGIDMLIAVIITIFCTSIGVFCTIALIAGCRTLNEESEAYMDGYLAGLEEGKRHGNDL